jgi:chromosome segregation ATPase
MERKEPTLTVSALEGEPSNAARQPSATQTKNPAPASKAKPVGSRPAPVYQPKPAGGGFVAGLALLVAIAATAGSGYLAWKLQQAEALLLSADGRLQSLEQRLDFTDEESSQSVESIRVKLKWADSEIRKLWGVSYDTNRKSIQINTDKLAKISKQAAAAQSASQKAQKLADSHQEQLQSVKKIASGDSARIEGALKTLEEQRKRLQDAVDKANKANTELARLRNDLGSRVKNNEEAIEAIDAYRARINRELNELKQRAGLQ